MEANIIRKIEAILGTNDSLPKVDPNTQAPSDTQSVSIEDAAVPAVLAGLYKKTRSEAGAGDVISSHGNSIFETIFVDQKDNVAASIANYTGTSQTDAYAKIENAANITRNYVLGHLKNSDATSLMNYFTAQRTNILTHLPAELKMGELLNDTTIDDRTNKMEGPMSDIMHGIEKIFSSSK